MLFLVLHAHTPSSPFRLLHPPKDHGCLHDLFSAAVFKCAALGRLGAGVGDGVAVPEVRVGSLQPNQPRVSQLEVALAVALGSEWLLDVGYEDVVVVSSKQPNHPGVLHVEIHVGAAVLEAVLPLVVVVSSRQPHHPGVLHVSVLVRVCVAVLLAVELLVELELLLSKYFQLKQSLQSLTISHFAGSSYAFRTVSMTVPIL